MPELPGTPERVEDAIHRLVRRRAELQDRLREAEDAPTYSRVLLDIAQLNREIATVSDRPAHRDLGFLRPADG